MLDIQPNLTGELIELRPLRPEDFDDLFACSTEKVWEQHPEKNRFKLDNFKVFFAAAIKSRGALVILDLKTSNIIGSSRYLGLDDNKVEIGYTFLSSEYWGKGINKELKKLMVNHAFQKVDQIFFYVGPENLRSRKAMENVGIPFLEYVDRVPDEGKPYTAALYGLAKVNNPFIDG